MFEVDEALNNAYAAFAKTNNPDDQVKIKNLYNLFKNGQISKSEFDKVINYYIQSNSYAGAYPAENNFNYTAGHSVNRDELRNAADHYEKGYGILDGKVAPVPTSALTRLIRGFAGNFIPGGSALMQGVDIGLQHNAESFANIGDSGVPAPADNKDEVAKLADAGKADSTENLVKADKAQANAYDPSIRLNNNIQYVMNTLKTYGYPQQVLDSFKQDIDKILANTKDNNRIDTANQYIDQFLGNKYLALQDLRRLDPAPGKPALDQQPQKAGAGVVKSGTQGTQGAQAGNNSGAIQGVQAGGTGTGTGKKPRMSDDEIDAFLKKELGENATGGTYASSGIPKGGTKTIGYNPIDEWNREHGISYNTGKDGVIYRTDPQHPNGYVDPFKNDLSTWTRATRSGSTGYATGQGMLTSGSNGTYATGEGIKDANGNVLTNPGGDWEYQYALKNPQYGLGMMGKMSDAQRNYLQAVSDDMGFNYNFKGAPRYV